MNKRKAINTIRVRRIKRTRAKIFGSADFPRLTVFRSNTGLYAQLINDEKGVTLAAASTRELAAGDRKKQKKEQSALLGKLIAERAKGAGIAKAVFDRRSYRYHGRIKSFVEAAREAGLQV